MGTPASEGAPSASDLGLPQATDQGAGAVVAGSACTTVQINEGRERVQLEDAQETSGPWVLPASCLGYSFVR